MSPVPYLTIRVGARRSAGPIDDGGPVGPAPIVDGFNRANSAVTMGDTDTGQTWLYRGTWGITANRAYLVTSVGASDNFAIVETTVPDGTIQATTAGALGDWRLAGRVASGGNLYSFYIAGNNCQIFKIVGNLYTSLGTYSGPFVVGDIIQAVMAGSTLSIKQNGVVRLVVTDSTYPTQTQHGLAQNATGAARYDDFSFVAA